jgi:hypothetical protein
LVDFQGARTKYFDDYVRAAAHAGIRQVVIVIASRGLVDFGSGVVHAW